MEQNKVTHHGKYLEELIDRSVKKTSEIIDLSGYSRTSIYRWLKEERLDLEKIHRIAIACGIDVEGELPELDYYRKIHHRKEDQLEKKDQQISKSKYVEVLEQLNEARQKLSDYQEKYFKLKEQIDKSKNV